jgi:hypothetical protein
MALAQGETAGHRPRRCTVVRVVALVCTCSVLLAAGCTPRRSAAGAPTVVNACAGFLLYDAQEEPKLDDASAVRRYADGLARSLAAVDPELRANRETVPADVRAAVTTLRRGAERLRTDAGAARDAAGLRAALSAHANDPALMEADAAFGRFDRNVCEKLQGAG